MEWDTAAEKAIPKPPAAGRNLRRRPARLRQARAQERRLPSPWGAELDRLSLMDWKYCEKPLHGPFAGGIRPRKPLELQQISVQFPR
jgi:hypothetical protein